MGVRGIIMPVMARAKWSTIRFVIHLKNMLVEYYGFDAEDDDGMNTWIENKMPWLKSRWGGMTIKQYARLLHYQRGCCGVCGHGPNGRGRGFASGP
jgi:hypothetical protein